MKKWHFFRPGIVLLCLLVSGWTQPAPAYAEGKELLIKILALNDFHGHLSKDGLHDKKASAPVLAAHLEAAAQGWEGRTFLVHAGDQIGASPAASALLKEEPSVIFLNILADRPGWSIIGTLGNHEFDQGKGALLRLIRRNHEGSRSLVKPYCGANFPYVCANVAHEGSDQPLLPPFVTRTVEGIPIAFIGAVTTETPQKVIKSKLSGLRFRDEANAINEQVALLKRWGVRSIVVLLHEGGLNQPPFAGQTRPWKDKVRGRIVDIVNNLDDEVDVVVSGHTHSFTNALIENSNHKKILVTQAFYHGKAFADINLKIDRSSKNVVTKSAQIKPASWNSASGLHPDPRVYELVERAQKEAKDKVKQMIRRDTKDPIGWASEEIPRTANKAGESALGNLVADAYREAGGTQFAFVNLGGIRTDQIMPGKVDWGELFCVQPFRNRLVTMRLTGQEIIDALKQPLSKGKSAGFLQVSGMKYTYTDNPSYKITAWEVTGKPTPIKKDAFYTVTVNEFMAGGRDNLALSKGRSKVKLNITDFEALINYVEKSEHRPLRKIEGRITKQ